MSRNSGLLLPYTTSYTCLIIDACWKDFFRAAAKSSTVFGKCDSEVETLEKLWTTEKNKNHVLPCLSVRSALDLYLQIMAFPEGSEVIMSAVNIPSMLHIVKHHKLKPVPLDINLDNTAPKIELLEHLITKKTKLILLAHIYGKWFETNQFVDIAQKYNIPVIEDCAEAFYGFDYIGNPRSELCLFSFGAIKYNTSFGGAIAKIRSKDLYEKMKSLQRTYPLQSRLEYLKKVLKYSMMYLVLNCPQINYGLRTTLQLPLRISHNTIHKTAVSLLRGFPVDMMNKIRHQPCKPLLQMMIHRQSSYDKLDTVMNNIKSEYVLSKLPEEMNPIGLKADVKNFWLFPVVVEYPDEIVKLLNHMGVDAYRGATQLSVIEPEPNGNPHLTPLQNYAIKYPHEAKYLIDHVVYLPVNKLTPFHDLDKICQTVKEAVMKCESDKLNGNGNHGLSKRFKLKSKL